MHSFLSCGRMCERARRKLREVRAASAASRRHDADGRLRRLHRLHVDASSRTTPPAPSPRTRAAPARRRSSARLRNIGLLYGHGGDRRVQAAATPLPEGGDKDRVYHRRGWTHLERRLGDLEAPASNCLDVSAWPKAAAERAAREDTAMDRGITAAQRGPPQLRESEEELAAQGDQGRYGAPPGTLRALIRDARTRRAGEPGATSPRSSRRRSSASTRIAPRAPGSTAASPSVSRRGEKFVGVRGRRRTGATWAARSRAARSCGAGGGRWARTMRRWRRSAARSAAGAAPCSSRASGNKIGDDFCAICGDALARGAAPALEKLGSRQHSGGGAAAPPTADAARCGGRSTRLDLARDRAASDA